MEGLSNILKLPEIPPDLFEKFRENKVAFFLGAGVSRILGCKGWSNLSRSIIDRCYERGCINYKQKDNIKKIDNPKKAITICHKILCDRGFEEDFYEVINASLIGREELMQEYNIYNELSRIPALYITTNIDEYFDDYFTDDRIVYEEADFNQKNIYKDKLYKIHGTIKNRETIIFTVPQYLNKYKNGEFIEFLRYIFEYYTVVFIGYGMEEFELLDFLITKFGERDVVLNHYILKDYFKGEEDLIDFDDMYFNPMGIKVIGYEKDDIGYPQLYYVIKNWKDGILQLSEMLEEDHLEMEVVIDTYDGRKDK